jgi:DNA-binding MarR family transcriptional regulator
LDTGAHRDLKVLEAIAEDEHMTQRGLASRLGIALGLTNLYLKRLISKGFVKCVNVRSNRVLYLITPKGIAEKSRLTYEFMDYSLRLYRDTRARVRSVLAPLARRERIRVAIYGTGEAAELTYVCLKELGVEPVAVFGDETIQFFNFRVQSVSDHASVAFDAMIVATFENPAASMAVLERHGVVRDRLVPIRDR